MPPDAVIFAQSTQEVAAVVTLCHASSVPVIAFGTGTSCEGGVGAIAGGICIDLSQMNTILQVNTADFDCRVQAIVRQKPPSLHTLHAPSMHCSFGQLHARFYTRLYTKG